MKGVELMGAASHSLTRTTQLPSAGGAGGRGRSDNPFFLRTRDKSLLEPEKKNSNGQSLSASLISGTRVTPRVTQRQRRHASE